jgi:hypothetical protein
VLDDVSKAIIEQLSKTVDAPTPLSVRPLDCRKLQFANG